MKTITYFVIALFGLSLVFFKCSTSQNSNQIMSLMLQSIYQKNFTADNPFAPGAALNVYDSILKLNLNDMDRMELMFRRGFALLSLGRESEAVQQLEFLSSRLSDPYDPSTIVLMKKLAVSYLRLGEKQNCVTNHTAESCLLPIRGTGIHKDPSNSQKAIAILNKILEKEPMDFESRWVLNIAYMTVGEYPMQVPKKFLIPNLDKDPLDANFKPFVDVAPLLGMHSSNLAGGSITDDFNGDGNLDIIVSDWSLIGTMHCYINDGKGGFSDQSQSSNLSMMTGGLNIMQTDYDNDGDLDIFVTRGAWLNKYGEQPNSLLRNNGDVTFTDVTIESGLLSLRPTQAAVWRDFNSDGWLDVFIGNEATPNTTDYPSQLFINDQKGHFTEVAEQAGCQLIDFIKGVTAGDYNNDGLEDIFISSLTGQQVLLKNMGVKNNIPVFQNVTLEAGLANIKTKTFPTWFWDYDNDGWLDIFVSGYDFGKSIATTTCMEAMGLEQNICQLHLYKNNKNGTFTNVSDEAGLKHAVYSMGANFGDVDNDGYLDMYLATGNPEFESLVPNRLFINSASGKFTDVTVAARVGNLQKGHGVSISDMDNDGDQDIFVEIGGAFPGDFFHNSFYLNPGQNNNNWIQVMLEGDDSNRAAIGSRIKLSITENGKKREIYRDVNSGGSFGSSALRKDIGLGSAAIIDELTITWHKSQKKQVFHNVAVNQRLKIKEGETSFSKLNLIPLRFVGDSSKIPMCKPSII